MSAVWPRVEWNGNTYLQCTSCNGWGRDGWAHCCKLGQSPHGNWYVSPQALEEAMEKRRKEVLGWPNVMTAEAPDAPS